LKHSASSTYINKVTALKTGNVSYQQFNTLTVVLAGKIEFWKQLVYTLQCN